MKMRGNAILPIGRINLLTGSSKYFNVYDTWGEETTYEIHQADDGGVRIVVTSGATPIAQPDKMNKFEHDQTGRHIFYGEIIDSAKGTELKKLVDKYGKSLSGYVYK
jgi:hypothetical protein